MLPEIHDLRDLQRWFQRRLLDPRARADAKSSVERFLDPTVGLTPTESLEVYRRMGWARFVCALEEDHQFTAALLGEERFERLCVAYLTRHPSRQWTLDDLGQNLPKFLSTWDGAGSHERSALSDLARLESALVRSVRLPAGRSIENEDLALLSGPQASEVRMTLAPSVQLLRLQHDAGESVRHYLDSGKPLLPRRTLTHIVVLRGGSNVAWWSEARDVYLVLLRLRRGASLGDAMMPLQRYRLDAVRAAFRRWAGAGVFSRLLIPEALASHTLDQ